MSDRTDLISVHEETIASRLLEYLNSKSSMRVIGQSKAYRKSRVPTISFVVDGIYSSTIPPKLDQHHIGIRYGDFYARRLIEYLGLAEQNEVVRVSMVHYNTIEEVDRLIAVFEQLF